MSTGTETKAAKSSGKRKASKDHNEAPAKQHKTEAKISGCPGCKSKQLLPVDMHHDRFCDKCREDLEVYFCKCCSVVFEHELEDGVEMCSRCLAKVTCPCGELHADEMRSCGVKSDEETEQEKPACKVCHKPVGDCGVCWEPHNMCSGKCGRACSLCQCVQLSTDEESMLNAFRLDARLNNIKHGNTEIGPDWEFMLEHAKKIVKMAEAKLEAQRKLRAV